MTSIWLRLEPSQEQALQSLIRSVAAEHGTVPFAPHLTVCGAPGDPVTIDSDGLYQGMRAAAAAGGENRRDRCGHHAIPRGLH